MEIEAVNGKANAGLTLGIIGTGLSVLSGGLGLFNTHGQTNGNKGDYITKDEAALMHDLSAKDSEIALLKAESNTESKMIEVYKQAHSEIAALRDKVDANQNAQNAWNASQSVINANMSAAIATNQNSIAALNATFGNLTKVIIPITNVCPEPMKRYNSWTEPTATSGTTPSQ